MKRYARIFSALLLLLLLLLPVLLLCMGSCSGEEAPDSTPDAEATSYTIQYTDDAGTHTLTVKSGDLYSLKALPSRVGYDFLGLFDAEVGGTQYVSAAGSALAAFSDNKNLMLFPQYSAKSYTIALDYQGAAVTSSRELAVSYGTRIPGLPTDLAKEHKVFVGWYTAPDCGGKQIADQYGVLPTTTLLTESTYDLTDANGFIHLFAGFKDVEYTVTFYAEANGTPEEVKVSHGTDIAAVIPTTRVAGKAVLLWSKTKNDTEKANIFSGKVTGDMILYAAEYAPYITFDANGGTACQTIVAREGAAITLPKPTREHFKFVEWQTVAGVAFKASAMPAESKNLIAVFIPVLTLNANGGSSVSNVAQAANTNLTLPTPTREGYEFAGWYEEDSLSGDTASYRKFTATAMPTAGLRLKAMWYKYVSESYEYEPKTAVDNNRTFTMSDKFFTVAKQSIKIKIDISTLVYCNHSNGLNESYYFYYRINFGEEKITDRSPATKRILGTALSSSYQSFELTVEDNAPSVPGPMIYVDGYSNYNSVYYQKGFTLTLSCLDTSQLY